jgi:hypothetical protein
METKITLYGAVLFIALAILLIGMLLIFLGNDKLENIGENTGKVALVIIAFDMIIFFLDGALELLGLWYLI